MSTSFPINLDTFTTKSNGDTLQPAHVNDIQDAVSALEAKVGVDGSSVATSHTKKIADMLTILGSCTAADLQKLHDLTATALELNIMDGVTGSTAEINAAVDAIKAATTQGDLLVKGASAIERLAAVAATQYLKSAGTGTKPAYSKLALRDTGVAIGWAPARSGTGTQVVSGIGFTPSVLITLSVMDTQACIGFASSGAVVSISQAGATPETEGYWSGSNQYLVYTSYDTMTLQSINSDGFTLSWSVRSAKSGAVFYLALP